jgi:hypothetical protein
VAPAAQAADTISLPRPWTIRDCDSNIQFLVLQNCISSIARNLSRPPHSPPPPYAKVRDPPPPSYRSTVLHAVNDFRRLNRDTNWSQPEYVLIIYLRSTFPRPDEPTARARTARSTPSTRSPVSRLKRPTLCARTEYWQNTRQERLRCSLRESVVMIASSPVTEVRPSPSSTRYDQPSLSF